MHSTVIEAKAQSIRNECDRLGEVQVPSDRLWGAQTQRSRPSGVCALPGGSREVRLIAQELVMTSLGAGVT